MFRFEYLCARQCTWELIHVLEELGRQASARAPLTIDEPSVGLLMLEALLRQEQTFLRHSLERLGVDVGALTSDLDRLLRQRTADARGAGVPVDAAAPAGRNAIKTHARRWLDRAEQQARLLGHAWLDSEHLLLAILAAADNELVVILQRQAITYDTLRKSLGQALADRPLPALPVPEGSHPQEAAKSSTSKRDRAAVGVARRFSVGVLLSLTTVYALLLGGMRMLDFQPASIVFWLVFFTNAGLGQPLLFEGERPRLASMCLGAVLFPIEISVLLNYFNEIGVIYYSRKMIERLTLLSIPAGVAAGYLAGCLAAGVFFLAEQYARFVEKRRRCDDANDALADWDPDAEPQA